MNLFSKLILLLLLNLSSESTSQICDQKHEHKGNITQEYRCLAYAFLMKPATNLRNKIKIYQPIFSSSLKLQLVESSKKLKNEVSKFAKSILMENHYYSKNSSNILNYSVNTNKSLNILNNSFVEHTGNTSLEVGGEDKNNNITFEEKAREDGYSITTAKDNPYAVALQISSKSGSGSCSATILTESWVLTAAHCLKIDNKLVDRVKVCAGGNSLKDFQRVPYVRMKGHQVLTSKEVYPHPRYNSDDIESYNYDVGLVLVEGKFIMTKYVKTLKLSTEPWTHFGYKQCIFTGFGTVNLGEDNKDDFKRKTHHLEVKNPCLCNYKLKMMFGRYLSKRIVCPKPKEDFGICTGDSGGGLICDGKVVGTASSLVNMYDVEYCEIEPLTKITCGTSESLSFFLTVCPNLLWINETAGIFEGNEISEKCVHFYNHVESKNPHYLFMIVAVLLLRLS